MPIFLSLLVLDGSRAEGRVVLCREKLLDQAFNAQRSKTLTRETQLVLSSAQWCPQSAGDVAGSLVLFKGPRKLVGSDIS